MKITKEQLRKIHELAKFNYRDSNEDLSPDEFVSACWVKAVMGELDKDRDLEFPKRIIAESVFDD